MPILLFERSYWVFPNKLIASHKVEQDEFVLSWEKLEIWKKIIYQDQTMPA